MNPSELFISVLILSIVTLFTRALPFIVFPESKQLPQWMHYFAKQLPYATLGMLVIYALKDAIQINAFPVFEVIALLVMTVIHRWKHQFFLTISSGSLLFLIIANWT